MPIWIKEKLFQKSVLIKELKKTIDKDTDWSQRLLFSEHHLSHAYMPITSPFDKSSFNVGRCW